MDRETRARRLIEVMAVHLVATGGELHADSNADEIHFASGYGSGAIIIDLRALAIAVMQLDGSDD
jgi:hypothetical protein